MDGDLSRFGLFRIHPMIYQGPFPKEATFASLRECRVPNIINVSGSTYGNEKFNVLNEPFPDGALIPMSACKNCLQFFRLCHKESEPVFIHCLAGQNRSGAISFLCLLSLGISQASAKKMIEEGTLDAVADHPRLIGQEHIALAKSWC